MTRRLLPVAAGLVVAALAFAAVVLATDGDGRAGEADSPAASSALPPASEGSVAAGRELFVRMGCGSCHRFAAAGSRGQIGPDLDVALAGHTRESIAAVVVAPPLDSPMPRDFGERLDRAELAALADFLVAGRRSP